MQHVGEIEQSSLVLIYDSESGKILHSHTFVTTRGGEPPDRQAMETQALRALNAGSRPSDIPLHRISFLHLDARDVRPDTAYDVDSKNGRLVEIGRISDHDKLVLEPGLGLELRKGAV